MNLVKGFLPDEIGVSDFIWFTSNNVINSKNELVMGAGAAKDIKNYFPDAPAHFGNVLTKQEDLEKLLVWVCEHNYDEN